MTKFLFSVLLYLSLTSELMSKSYALIVGIDNYRNAPHLSGAVADAEALEKLLKKYHIYNTKVLLNSKANKQAIITALTTISRNIKKGDHFYMFFSGHGTSLEDKSLKASLDKDSKLLKELENSGALLPYNFDKYSASASLIIGSRDLRPLFQKIDNTGAKSLIVFDACFSGMTYRSIPDRRTRRRHYALSSSNIEFNIPKSHPYQSLVYVASTSSSDWAVEDVSTNRGYLMQQLEQCLDGEADKNMDNNIFKEELKLCIDNSNLPQSPQIYPKALNKNSKVFKLNKRYNIHNPKPSKNDELKVKVFNGIYTVSDRYGKIASFSDSAKLAKYKESYKIIQIKNKNLFSLQALNEKGVKQKNYTVGDEIYININSNKSGYLVLFNLDAAGNLHMIEPYPDKTVSVERNKMMQYTELTIIAPAGTEIMKGFIIFDKNIIQEIQKLSPDNDTGLVENSSAIYNLLSKLSPNSYATALLKLTTHKKN